MSDSKLAFTWADLLLILVLATLGAGVCSAAARVAEQAMAPRAPREAAFQDSVHLPRLEQALSGAGDERNALVGQLRELRIRQMRDSVALVMGDSDGAALRSATPPASRAVLDSLGRERARLRRSLRADAALAVRLGAAVDRWSDSVALSRGAVAAARARADRRYRQAQRRFALERAGWTAAGALAAAVALLGITAWALRRRQGRTRLVRPGRDLGVAAALIALILARQLLGAPLTLFLGAAAALLVLLPHVNHDA